MDDTTDTKELLERAAGWYEPAEPDPGDAARRTGRHQRRQRVAAVVVAFAVFAAAGTLLLSAFEDTGEEVGTTPSPRTTRPLDVDRLRNEILNVDARIDSSRFALEGIVQREERLRHRLARLDRFLRPLLRQGTTIEGVPPVDEIRAIRAEIRHARRNLESVTSQITMLNARLTFWTGLREALSDALRTRRPAPSAPG